MKLANRFTDYRKKLRSVLKIIVPLVLGGIILWWMYRGMDWAVVVKALRTDMNWSWMLLSFPFGILAQVLRALRWRQALRPMGERPRLSVCTDAIFLSYASSLVVPRAGEVVRCGILRRFEGVSFSRSVGTVFTERVVDMLTIAVLALLTFVLQIPVFMAFFRRTGISLTSVLSGFTWAGYAVTFASGILALFMGWLLWKRLRHFARTRSVISELREGLLSVRRVDSPLLFILYSIGIWACYYMHFYLTFYCFSTTSALGPMVALVAFVVGTFAVLVPTPNGAGPWHFAVKTVLMLYGIAGDTGALFALIVHTIQTLLVAALGIWSIGHLMTVEPTK